MYGPDLYHHCDYVGLMTEKFQCFLFVTLLNCKVCANSMAVLIKRRFEIVDIGRFVPVHTLLFLCCYVALARELMIGHCSWVKWVTDLDESRGSWVCTSGLLTHDQLTEDYVHQITRTISITAGIRPIWNM